MAITSRPLLAVDGDLFAHRAYHALPKSIRRRGNQGGGAIVGFANLLLRLYEDEQPRAVLVGWDTLDAPTYRHKALEGYQGGRRFDAELIDQLEMLPEFVAACGFACAKAAGYEADDFLAAAVADEEGRGGTVLVASGDRDAFQLASDKTTILQPVRAGEMARIGPAGCSSATASSPGRCPTSSPCVAIPRTSCRVPRVSDRRVRRSCCASTARSNRRSKLASWRCRRTTCGFIAGSRRWTARHRCPRCPTRHRPGQPPLTLRVPGS